MTNEKIVEFFKNHPKLFVDLIFRWYPINLKILFKILNKMPERFSYEAYTRLSKNEIIINNPSLLEIIEDDINWHAVSKNFGNDLPNEFIKRNFKKLEISLLNKVDPKDLTDEFIDKLKADYNLISKNKMSSVAKSQNFSNQSLDKLPENYNSKESKTIWENRDLSIIIPWNKTFINHLTNLDYEKCTMFWYDIENPNIPWSLELLDDYEYYWNWDKIIESEKVWNIVFKKTLNDELILSVIDGFNKKENYEDYTYRFNSTPNFYTINSSLDFGLYKGKRIIDAFKDDQDYFNNLLESSGPFYLSKDFLKKLETNTTFKFTEKAYKMANKKQLHAEKENLNERMRDEDNYNQNHTKDFDFLNDALEGDPINYWNID